MCISVGHNIASNLLNTTSIQLKHISSPQITKDWGNNLANEKRTELSQGLARNTFLNNGSFRDYIDLSGNLREYQPSEADHQYRVRFLHSLEQLDNAVTVYFCLFLVWLLIPLLAVAIGFTPLVIKLNLINEQFTNHINKRLCLSKKSAK